MSDYSSKQLTAFPSPVKVKLISRCSTERRTIVHVFVTRDCLSVVMGRRFCQASLQVFETDHEAVLEMRKCGRPAVGVVHEGFDETLEPKCIAAPVGLFPETVA